MSTAKISIAVLYLTPRTASCTWLLDMMTSTRSAHPHPPRHQTFSLSVQGSRSLTFGLWKETVKSGLFFVITSTPLNLAPELLEYLDGTSIDEGINKREVQQYNIQYKSCSDHVLSLFIVVWKNIVSQSIMI